VVADTEAASVEEIVGALVRRLREEGILPRRLDSDSALST
jgi:hypothetical protein